MIKSKTYHFDYKTEFFFWFQFHTLPSKLASCSNLTIENMLVMNMFEIVYLPPYKLHCRKYHFF